MAAPACQGQGTATRNAPPKPREKASGLPFAVRFSDVAERAGLQMKFTSGGVQSKKYIIEANGTGLAFLDYDRDGRLDIFAVNGSSLDDAAAARTATSHLFHNEGAGQFRDVTAAAGLARSGWGNGVCIGDSDNDGFDEIYATYWGKNAFFKNNGSGKFVDVAAQAGVDGDGKTWSSGCTFIDYDRDGLLDLLVTSYQAFDLATTPTPGKGATCEWKGMPVFCGPRGLPSGKVSLFHNRGDGTFEDVSVRSGMRKVENFYAFTAVAVDLNDDGWTDVYIACDSTPSIFFRNNKDGTFTDIATETGLAYNENGFEQGGMGIAVGDYDNDGRMDLMKTNFAGDYPNLFHNIGQGIFEESVVKAGLAANPQYVGWGVGFVDLDNDGWKDIVQVNGHVYPELEGGSGSEKYRNPRLVYRNLGDGRFEDMSASTGPGITEAKSSRGAAFGDFDNDGDMDVLVMNMSDAPSLLRNDLTNANHWLKVELQGTRSNRDAIGASVTAVAGDLRQRDVVLSQGSYVSRNDPRLHFGLEKRTAVDQLIVRWPNGETESFPGAPADRLVRLVEGSGKTVVQPLPR